MNVHTVPVFPREVNWWAGALCKTDPGQKANESLYSKLVHVCTDVKSAFIIFVCMLDFVILMLYIFSCRY